MRYVIISKNLSSMSFADLDNTIRTTIDGVETVALSGNTIYVEFADGQVNDTRKAALQNLDTEAEIYEEDVSFKGVIS